MARRWSDAVWGGGVAAGSGGAADATPAMSARPSRLEAEVLRQAQYHTDTDGEHDDRDDDHRPADPRWAKLCRRPGKEQPRREQARGEDETVADVVVVLRLGHRRVRLDQQAVRHCLLGEDV